MPWSEILQNSAPVIAGLLVAVAALAFVRFGRQASVRRKAGRAQAAPAGGPPGEAAATLTSLTLDGQLMSRAQAYTGLEDKSALIREALKALIEREAARRLALLGGSEPDLVIPPRRRSE